MPPALPPDDEDEAYHSSSDSDFEAALSPSSGDESNASTDAAVTNHKRKKRRVNPDGDFEMGSGDEGVIAQGKRKKSTKGKAQSKAKAEDKATDEEEEDDADEDKAVGIRVKLRSGRGGKEAARKKVHAFLATNIDIESIWARMNNPQASQPPPPPSSSLGTSTQQDITTERQPLKDLSRSTQTSAASETMTIPHTYMFAGETHTSIKTVPANSPEALAYLASKKRTPDLPQGPALRRPYARKGLLEPNPSGSIKGVPSNPRPDLPPNIGGNGTKSLSAENKVSRWEGGTRKKKDVKLNTVEKSKIDWEQEVERQGMREELEKAEKSGTNYLGRMEFLGRAETAREEEGRRWRMAGRV